METRLLTMLPIPLVQFVRVSNSEENGLNVPDKDKREFPRTGKDGKIPSAKLVSQTTLDSYVCTHQACFRRQLPVGLVQPTW